MSVGIVMLVHTALGRADEAISDLYRTPPK